MTVFKLDRNIEKGDVVILINFICDEYRGGMVFRVGEETRVIVN